MNEWNYEEGMKSAADALKVIGFCKDMLTNLAYGYRIRIQASVLNGSLERDWPELSADIAVSTQHLGERLIAAADKARIELMTAADKKDPIYAETLASHMHKRREDFVTRANTDFLAYEKELEAMVADIKKHMGGAVAFTSQSGPASATSAFFTSEDSYDDTDEEDSYSNYHEDYYEDDDEEEE